MANDLWIANQPLGFVDSRFVAGSIDHVKGLPSGDGNGVASLQHTFLVGPVQSFETLFYDNEGWTVDRNPRHEKFLALNDVGRGANLYTRYNRPLHFWLQEHCVPNSPT